MTPESLLISALSAVTGGLCFLFRIIWTRSVECEKWRVEKEPIINEMSVRLGLAEGVANFVNACATKGCPFKGKLDPSYSVEKNNETKTLKKPKV